MEFFGGGHVEHAIADDGCAEALDIFAELDLLDDFTVLLAWLHHDELAFQHGAVEQAIHIQRGGVQVGVAEFLLPHLLARVGVDGVERSAVIELVDHIANHHG